MRPMPTDGPACSLRTRQILRLVSVVALAWGAQAIITQSLLLREATVLMSGSELVWGIVLSAWLAGVAVGAWAGGRLARRTARARRDLAIALLLLGGLACVSIWGFREARAACGVGPGELLSLSAMAIVALVLVLPCGLMVGTAFPLAGAIADRAGQTGPAGSINTVYALESCGSLLGGAIFTFWVVEHWSPIQTALACAAVTGAALAALLAAGGARRIGISAIVAVSVGAAAAAVFAGSRLDRFLVERRWRRLSPACELVAEVESRYQNLAIGRMAEQYTLYCDGQVSADFPDPSTFAPPAHFWMCQHPEPRRVLVIGGGVEGLLSEILKHPVEHVDCIEPDPRLITLVEPYLTEPDRSALRDSRVAIHHEDARLYVKTQHNRFDVVIARLPEPTSALRARLYTREFFGELRRSMTDRSILALTAAAAHTRLPPAAARYLAGVRGTVAAVFPEVLVGWGDPACILAATQQGLISHDPAQLAERYRRRGIESRWFDPVWFAGATDWFAVEKVRQRSAELDVAAGASVSTDLRPIVYLHRLALWEQMTAAHSRRLIERLINLRWEPVLGVLAVVALLTLVSHLLLGRSIGEGVVVLSIGSTGFATMSLSLVMLFAFQNLYGYVYQWIGWLIAVFMGGLVIGCAWAGRSFRGPATDDPVAVIRRRLIAVDLLLAAVAGSVPLMLPALGRMQVSTAGFGLVQACILTFMLAAGVLGGAAFALGSRLHQAASGRPKTTAGVVVGADYAGAFVGALTTGVILVPVFGIVTAVLLLAGVKVVSACLLMLARKSAVG